MKKNEVRLTGGPRMPRTHVFTALLMGAVLTLASFAALSCNGTGDASDMNGETYNPGGGVFRK